MGYNIDNWKELQDKIKKRAPLYPTRRTGNKGYGMAYEQKMVLYGKKKRPANVVVSRIDEDETLCMTSSYIEVKEYDD